MQFGTSASLVVLFLVNLLNFYDRQVPGAITEPMRKEFGLSDAQLGLLGSAFIWVYAFIGLPLGRVADVWSRRKLLAGGTAIWSGMTALSGIAINFPLLMISRLGVGVGEAVCAPTATSWIGDIVPAERRTRALAIFNLGIPLGAALSLFLAGAIAQRWGWRAALVSAAAPALLLVPALLMCKEPQRTGSGSNTRSSAIAAVLRIPTMWWIIVSGALINFNMYAMASFLPALLGRVHHLSVREAGLATGIAYLVGGLSGGFVAATVGDWIGPKRKDGKLLAAAVLALAIAPFTYLGVIQPMGAVVMATAMLAIGYGLMNTYYGLVYSAIQDVVGPAQRGVAMAVYFFAMYMLGASFGPMITGRLSDLLARRAADAAGSTTVTEVFRAIGLQQAMLIMPVLSVVLALVLWMSSRTVTRDIQRREATAGEVLVKA